MNETEDIERVKGEFQDILKAMNNQTGDVECLHSIVDLFSLDMHEFIDEEIAD